MHAFLHSARPETYDLVTLESKMHFENTWLWTVLYHACHNYSKRLTFMQKWSAALLIAIPFCILTRHPHSIHLQDFPLDLWYSLRPQPTSQMQSIATQAPHPWYSFSSTCTPLLRLGSLKSSSYLSTNLSYILYKATWPSCWHSEKIYNN